MPLYEPLREIARYRRDTSFNKCQRGVPELTDEQYTLERRTPTTRL